VNAFNTWFTGLLLLLFGAMVALAFQFPPDARLAPLIVGVPGTLLCSLQLAFDVIRAPGGRFAPKVGKPTAAALEARKFGPHTLSRELAMWGYFLTFVAVLLLFGFYVAVPLMLIAFLHFEAKINWTHSVLAGVGGTAMLYLTFDLLLHIELHTGLLTPSINTFGPQP
jgi:hypothetical protein